MRRFLVAPLAASGAARAVAQPQPAGLMVANARIGLPALIGSDA